MGFKVMRAEASTSSKVCLVHCLDKTLQSPGVPLTAQLLSSLTWVAVGQIQNYVSITANAL